MSGRSNSPRAQHTAPYQLCVFDLSVSSSKTSRKLKMQYGELQRMALCFIESQLALAKQRYFLLKVLRSKSLYKIMVLSIVCLIIRSFVFCLHKKSNKVY
jgi:hypothetical protein